MTLDDLNDENLIDFDQLNKNIKEGYKKLMGTIPRIRKVKCKTFIHETNVNNILIGHILEGKR